MKKIFILDTNVLLTDPNAIYAFKNNDIILPFEVLEEMDKKKKLQDIVGSNARQVIKELDILRNKGSLCDGVKLGKGKGFLFVKDTNFNILPTTDFNFTKTDTPDNRIIAVAYSEKQNNPDKKITIVSRDINVRVKSDSIGIQAEGYETDRVIDKKEHMYSGFTSMLVDDQEVDKFYNGGNIIIDKEEHKFYPNEFIMLVSNIDNKKTALAKFTNYSTPLKKVTESKGGIWGLKSRNKEQMFSFNLLMDTNVPLVTLSGIAGSGKTLCAIAAGLEQTLESKIYKRFVVIRPVMPLGRDIGFLPGDMREKLTPWLTPITDNLRYLFDDKFMLDDYIKKGIIEIEALTYIRGRSISDAYILIDECQNLNAHELKTILTRAGDNTKIVLTGDLKQIDSPYLNETTSGFTNVIEKFKSQDISGHITLTKGERSILATLSAKIL